VDTRDLPTGIVTFLFTDVEGSTRLLEQLGEKTAQSRNGTTPSCGRRSPRATAAR
jgi:hypothetical protein